MLYAYYREQNRLQLQLILLLYVLNCSLTIIFPEEDLALICHATLGGDGDRHEVRSTGTFHGVVARPGIAPGFVYRSRTVLRKYLNRPGVPYRVRSEWIGFIWSEQGRIDDRDPGRGVIQTRWRCYLQQCSLRPGRKHRQRKRRWRHGAIDHRVRGGDRCTVRALARLAQLLIGRRRGRFTQTAHVTARGQDDPGLVHRERIPGELVAENGTHSAVGIAVTINIRNLPIGGKQHCGVFQRPLAGRQDLDSFPWRQRRGTIEEQRHRVADDGSPARDRPAVRRVQHAARFQQLIALQKQRCIRIDQEAVATFACGAALGIGFAAVRSPENAGEFWI